MRKGKIKRKGIDLLHEMGGLLASRGISYKITEGGTRVYGSCRMADPRGRLGRGNTRLAVTYSTKTGKVLGDVYVEADDGRAWPVAEIGAGGDGIEVLRRVIVDAWAIAAATELARQTAG